MHERGLAKILGDTETCCMGDAPVCMSRHAEQCITDACLLLPLSRLAAEKGLTKLLEDGEASRDWSRTRAEVGWWGEVGAVCRPSRGVLMELGRFLSLATAEARCRKLALRLRPGLVKEVLASPAGRTRPSASSWRVSGTFCQTT